MLEGNHAARPALVVIAAIIGSDIDTVAKAAAREPGFQENRHINITHAFNFLRKIGRCSPKSSHRDLECIAKSAPRSRGPERVGTYVELCSRPDAPIGLVSQTLGQVEVIWPSMLPQGPINGAQATALQEVNFATMRDKNYDNRTLFGQLYLAGHRSGFQYFHFTALHLAGPKGADWPLQ